MAATTPTGPIFSRSGVSLAEVRELQHAFDHATRWLLPGDGSTRLGVSLVDGAITTPAAPPSASAVEVLACGGEQRGGKRVPGEIVARTSDGRLFAVDQVRLDGDGRGRGAPCGGV
jgi:hypothetical protein